MTTHWIAYHSEALVGREYAHRGSDHKYYVDRNASVLAPLMHGATVWVIVGRPTAGSRTTFLLHCSFRCTRVVDAGAGNPKRTVIEGSEIAFFSPGIRLNEEAWWSTFFEEMARFQGGLKQIRSNDVIGELQRLTADDEISTHAVHVELQPSDDELEKGAGALEGDRVLVQHYRYERDRTLVNRKLRAALRQHGEIQCECCGFNFKKAYGEKGREFCEVHHRVPLSRYRGRSSLLTTEEDLAIVCANCHRVLHWHLDLTVEELRSHLRNAVTKQRVLVRGGSRS